MYLLIKTEWNIYASVNYAITDSDNGLAPSLHQAIIWINAGVLLIEPLGTNLGEIFYRNLNIFIDKFAFKNVVCQSGGHLVPAWMC